MSLSTVYFPCCYFNETKIILLSVPALINGTEYSRTIQAFIILKACLQALMFIEVLNLSLFDEQGNSIHPINAILTAFDEALEKKLLNANEMEKNV